MTSPFMMSISELLAERGVATTRFNFPYMTTAQKEGTRRPPPPVAQLAEVYRAFAAVQAAKSPREQALFVGGKSMGGRVATMIIDDLLDAELSRGAVVYGYPFHPQRKPDQLRTVHLEKLKAPTVIVQGTRDALGHRDEVGGYTLSKQITLAWAEDGNHDLLPRKASGFTHQDHLRFAADQTANWLHAQAGRRH